MPWLPIYADSKDFLGVVRWLSEDDRVAFVVRPRTGWLVAVPRLQSVSDGRYALWSVESGPLPYYRLRRGWLGKYQAIETVRDPWSGWEESVTSATGEPWFGGSYGGVNWLNVQTRSLEQPGGIGLSSFERHLGIGEPALAGTSEVWADLRAWVRKHSRRVPREGSIEGSEKEIHAFPNALAALRAGCWRDRNPGLSAEFHLTPLAVEKSPTGERP